jgi:hypothetical protein
MASYHIVVCAGSDVVSEGEAPNEVEDGRVLSAHYIRYRNIRDVRIRLL